MWSHEFLYEASPVLGCTFRDYLSPVKRCLLREAERGMEGEFIGTLLRKNVKGEIIIAHFGVSKPFSTSNEIFYHSNVPYYEIIQRIFLIYRLH